MATESWRHTCSARYCQVAVNQPASDPRTRRSSTFFLQIRKKREPTSGLEPLPCSLRVSGHALRGFARSCKSRISKRVSFLCLAPCCTVLRSRWYQSGIRSPWITTRRFLCARQARRNGDDLPATSRVHAGPHPAMGGGISMPCSAATSTTLSRLSWSSKTSGLPLLAWLMRHWTDGEFLLRRLDPLTESSGSPRSRFENGTMPSETILRQVLLGRLQP